MKKRTKICLLFLLFWVNSLPLWAQKFYEYSMYEGTINQNLKIRMRLNVQSSEVAQNGEESTHYGYYLYTKNKAKLHVSGKIQKGIVNLTEKNEKDEVTGYFEGSFDGKTIQGTWKNATKTKSFPFVLSVYTPKGSMDFDLLKEEAEYTLKMKREVEEMPKGYFNVSTVIPKANHPQATPIKKQILKSLNLAENVSDVQSALKESKDSYFEGYQKENESFANEMSDEEFYPNMLTWENTFIVYPSFNESNVLCLNTDYYTFMGGAHGVGGTTFKTFNLQTGKEISLQDIFGQNIPAIEKMINQKAKNFYGEPLEENGFLVDAIKITENFYVDHAGIGFTYNVYEVAAYAMGPIDVYFNYAEIKNMIVEGSPILQIVNE